MSNHDTEKMVECAKCHKIKKESEGSYVLNGTTFCCENCCKKNDSKEEGVCEFC